MAANIKFFSIDLHGHNRAQALVILDRRLNQASWERNSSQRVFVVIDTGLGKHSGCGGAVLRPFVQQLLERRGYEFRESRGKFQVLVWHNNYSDSISQSTGSGPPLSVSGGGIEPSTSRQRKGKKKKQPERYSLQLGLGGGALPLRPGNSLAENREFPSLSSTESIRSDSRVSLKLHPSIREKNQRKGGRQRQAITVALTESRAEADALEEAVIAEGEDEALAVALSASEAEMCDEDYEDFDDPIWSCMDFPSEFDGSQGDGGWEIWPDFGFFESDDGFHDHEQGQISMNMLPEEECGSASERAVHASMSPKALEILASVGLDCHATTLAKVAGVVSVGDLASAGAEAHLRDDLEVRKGPRIKLRTAVLGFLAGN